MKHLMAAAAATLALGAFAAPASASTVLVSFDFLSGATSVASGHFTYDSADSGVIGWGDVLSYDISFPGENSYDLAFVNSGNDSVYRYFGFDTGSHTFVTAVVGGFPEIMSDIKNPFDAGFFTRDDAAFQVVRDYGPGGTQESFDTLKISVSGGVPEPATWALMLIGVGLCGVSIRKQRRLASVPV